MNSEFQEHSRKSRPCPDRRETGEVTPARKHMTSTFQESTCKSREHFQNSRWQGAPEGMNGRHSTYYDPKNCEVEEHSQDSLKQEWCELNEVVESDFLISPGDIYSNRKVELEDADIKEATRVSFEALCEQQHEAFSKNNKDIGRTQLIEMEIDGTVSIHLTVKTLRLGTTGNRDFGKIWCLRKEPVKMGVASDCGS